MTLTPLEHPYDGEVMIRVEIRDDAESTCAAAAQSIASALVSSYIQQGRASFAVSGGKTPALMLTHLSHQLVPWDHVAIFQVDERWAPVGHPDRNASSLLTSFQPSAGSPTMHLMEVPESDTQTAGQAACNAYSALLPRQGLDVVHLGLGDDGHTASLIPGDHVLSVVDELVGETGSYQGRKRITLTTPALRSARLLIWLAIGSSKAPMVRRLLAGDQSIPAGRFADRPGIMFLDRAAARELDRV